MSYQTPFSQQLGSGSYRITMPPTVVDGADTYDFTGWQDGITDNPRTINLQTDISLVAQYTKVVVPPPTQEVTPCTFTLAAGNYTVSAPSSVIQGTEVYNFAHWENGSTNPVRQVNLNQDLAFTVTYEKVTVDLTINVNDLTMGTTDPIPAIHKITQGNTVQISAIPSTGYMFDHWELDGVNVGTSNPYSVTMDTNHVVLAVFVIKPPPPPGKQHLTISSTTGGTTTPAAGVWEYGEGSTAQVTATPNTGYIFKHWLFDNVIAGTDPTIAVLMDVDHTLVAVFEAVPPTPRLWNWPFLTWLQNLIKQRKG